MGGCENCFVISLHPNRQVYFIGKTKGILEVYISGHNKASIWVFSSINFSSGSLLYANEAFYKFKVVANTQRKNIPIFFWWFCCVCLSRIHFPRGKGPQVTWSSVCNSARGSLWSGHSRTNTPCRESRELPAVCNHLIWLAIGKWWVAGNVWFTPMAGMSHSPHNRSTDWENDSRICWKGSEAPRLIPLPFRLLC